MGNTCKSTDVEEVLPTYDSSVKFIPPVVGGHVVKVYDGDTITIATRLPFINDNTYYRFSVRLRGLDCPEMRGPYTDKSEHAIAIIARDRVRALIHDRPVILSDVSTDKYGRLLANVSTNDDFMSITDILINERLAVVYNGKRKQSPASWYRYHKGLGMD